MRGDTGVGLPRMGRAWSPARPREVPRPSGEPGLSRRWAVLLGALGCRICSCTSSRSRLPACRGPTHPFLLQCRAVAGSHGRVQASGFPALARQAGLPLRTGLLPDSGGLVRGVRPRRRPGAAARPDLRLRHGARRLPHPAPGASAHAGRHRRVRAHGARSDLSPEHPQRPHRQHRDAVHPGELLPPAAGGSRGPAAVSWCIASAICAALGVLTTPGRDISGIRSASSSWRAGCCDPIARAQSRSCSG